LLLGVVAGGAGIYAVTQAPQSAAVAVRADGSLVLRLETNLDRIAAPN
jgi:hypothetical protein